MTEVGARRAKVDKDGCDVDGDGYCKEEHQFERERKPRQRRRFMRAEMSFFDESGSVLRR